MGGADARGGTNDTAVVYTPAFHEYNDQGQRVVGVWNVTLPLHFFSRAPIDPEGEVYPSISEMSQMEHNVSSLVMTVVTKLRWVRWSTMCLP